MLNQVLMLRIFQIYLDHLPHVSCCRLIFLLPTSQLLPELIVSEQDPVLALLVHLSEDQTILAGSRVLLQERVGSAKESKTD